MSKQYLICKYFFVELILLQIISNHRQIFVKKVKNEFFIVTYQQTP